MFTNTTEPLIYLKNLFPGAQYEFKVNISKTVLHFKVQVFVTSNGKTSNATSVIQATNPESIEQIDVTDRQV